MATSFIAVFRGDFHETRLSGGVSKKANLRKMKRILKFDAAQENLLTFALGAKNLIFGADVQANR
jgi:hypothetical protein